jgi:hypothetical protein
MNRAAEKPLSADHEGEGDNLGVGGMPAEKPTSEEVQPGEPRRESTG